MLDPQDALKDALGCLKRALASPVLTNRWPTKGEQYSLSDALKTAGLKGNPEDILRVAEARQAMLGCPVIAVLGELNAGKSSVVAGFLSERGKARLPRGLGFECGTHRFVYWVPSKWLEDKRVTQAFYDLLAAVHGPARDFLSQDPKDAAEQYRSGQGRLDLLRIPLIADDPTLDELNVAFLDCPDIQTLDGVAPHPTDPGGNPRLEFLAKTIRLCSAFLFVWQESAIRDSLFTKFLAVIRARLPSAPLYLLINKIVPEEDQPTATRNHPNLVGVIEKFKPRACYGAFHVRIGNWKQLTPPRLVERFESRSELPFFELSPNSESNRAMSVDESRFLSSLPRTLEVAPLQREALSSHWHEISTSISKDLTEIRNWAVRSNKDAIAVHDGLLEFCTRQFRNAAGEPQQIPNEHYTDALASSFLRTAPVYLRPGLFMQSGFKWMLRRMRAIATGALPRMQKALQRWLETMLTLGAASNAPAALAAAGIHGGHLANATTLASEMASAMALGWCPAAIDPDQLAAAWTRILRDFRAVELKFDSAELDRITADFWKHLSWRQTLRLGISGPLTVLGTVAALGGAVVALVDGGATLLVTIPLATQFANFVPGVLFGTFAVAGGVGAITGFLLGVLLTNTLPYLSVFFRLSCDAFGVPFEVLPGKCNTVRFGTTDYPLPAIDVPYQQPCCSLGEFRLWDEGEGVAKIRDVLHGK